MRRRFLGMALAIMVAALLLVGVLRLTPDPAPFRQLTFSHAFLAENGELLRLTTAADGRYRLWTPLAGFAPSLKEATLAKEDRRFHWHLGVDPLALARAAFGHLTGAGRSGASTLTMQLARLVWRLETRSVLGKLRQMLYAAGLEARWTKDEILEAYLNLAPYGGNVEGAGAAAWLYFGKAPRALTEPESLRLALLPQSPGRRAFALRGPRRARAAEKASALVLAGALRPDSVSAKRLVKDAYDLVPRDREAMPWRAPHFVERLKRQLPSPPARSTGAVATTLDLGVQDLVERQIARHLESFSRVGIKNAAVLVLHHPTMKVRAYAGSADFKDSRLDGQVDGIRARRSPGSTLKPLLYAQALDEGLIHPLSLLLDLPSGFGSYDPENFDKSFSGPVDATTALVASRNVPAIELLNSLTAEKFQDMLMRGGVRFRSDAKHYGLTLAIGGAEVSMEELAILYGALADDGRTRPMRFLEAGERAGGTPVLSREAAYLARTMLTRNPRPGEKAGGMRALGLLARRAPLEVAWKTGTSFGLRDAWAVGIAGEWVVAVWLGDFKGRPNSYLIGRDTAGPLLFKVIDALASERADATLAPLVGPPKRLKHELVCAVSGDMPTAACPVKRETWFIPGVSPTHACSLHKLVPLNAMNGRRICPGSDTSKTRIVERAFEFWPTDALRAFARLGVPRRGPPPFENGCGNKLAGSKERGAAVAFVRILSPRKNLVYPVPVEIGRSADPILLAARAGSDAGRIYWFLDEALLGDTAPGETLPWRPRPGKWVVRAIDQRGNADAREVTVIAAR